MELPGPRARGALQRRARPLQVPRARSRDGPIDSAHGFVAAGPGLLILSVQGLTGLCGRDATWQVVEEARRPAAAVAVVTEEVFAVLGIVRFVGFALRDLRLPQRLDLRLPVLRALRLQR